MNIEPTLQERLELCAVDGNFFARTFFGRTVRQASPSVHTEVWDTLDDPKARLVNIILPRGFAKTSILRLFTARRIAFSMARTILYVGASQDHAIRSLQWIRRAIEFNRLFAETFQLSPGRKWQETEIEIQHGLDAQPIWVLGVGITGNIRGINFDDYRPDLIVLDDILTDENAATVEQREKIKNLVFGALRESLAPRVESPNAKLVMLNTPQNSEDVAMQATQDPSWASLVRSCWTEETKDLPLDHQQSAWPELWPSDELRKMKSDDIAANRLSVFLRERECRLTSPETSTFRTEWLQYYKEAPQGIFTVVSIDPVPPPTDRQIQKALKGKDFEAICVWGRKGPDYYLLEYRLSRGHQPNWTVATTFELAMRWRAAKIVCEQVGYQTVLKGLLETEMARRQTFYPVLPVEGQARAKFVRITNAFAGIGSQHHIYVRSSHVEFIEQFGLYGPVYKDHDDLLDASASAVLSIMNPYLELGEDDFLFEGDDPKDELSLSTLERCP